MAQALKIIELHPGEAIDIDATTAARWLNAAEAILVDVRETAEYEAERIPGALLMPLSCFDAERFPRLKGMKVVLHCAAGKRSAAAGKQLIAAGHPRPFNLIGGIQGWKAAGHETDTA